MKKILLPILIVILIIIGGSAIYFYKKANTLSSSNGAVQAQTDDILAKVKTLILLPEGEVPTIATVSDISKLKDQPFFAKAKVGDRVIMYPKSKKAYLYDPVANKILEVAPIALGTQESASTVNTESTTTTKPATKK